MAHGMTVYPSNGGVRGDLEEILAPVAARKNDLTTVWPNDRARIWWEGYSSIVTPLHGEHDGRDKSITRDSDLSGYSSWAVDISGDLSSYMLHFDPGNASSVTIRDCGHINFSQPIVGLFCRSESLVASDSSLRVGIRPIYPNLANSINTQRGYVAEVQPLDDQVQISNNRRTLTIHKMVTGGQYYDQMRIVTTAPALVAQANGPYAYSLLRPSLTLSAIGSSFKSTSWTVRDNRTFTYSWFLGSDTSQTAIYTGTDINHQISASVNFENFTFLTLIVSTPSGAFATDTAPLIKFVPSCPTIDATFPFSTCNLYGQQPPIPSPNGPYEVYKNRNIVWNNVLPGFDGTGSYDPDGGDIQRYRWIIDGSWIISDTDSIITPPISWNTLRTHPLGVSPDSTHSVTLTVVDDDINVTGDTLGELSDWSFDLPLRLADMDQTAWFTWYWRIVNNGSLTTTVSIYRDVNRVNLVARGTSSFAWANGGVITLSPQVGSTLSGYVTVRPNANTQDHLISDQLLSYSRTMSAPVNLFIHPARNPSVGFVGPFVLAVIPGGTSIATDSAHLIANASSPDGDRIVYSWTLSRSDIATINLGTDSTIWITYDNLHRVSNLKNNANISIDTGNYLITCTVSVLPADVYPGDPIPTSTAEANLTLLNTSPIVVSADSAHLLQWANTTDNSHGTVTLNSSGSRDLDGTIDLWEWRIGDDPDRLNQTRISTDSTPTFTWGSVGTIVASDTAFSLNLWAMDNDGIWGSDSSVLFYQPNHAPTCSIIDGPYTVLVNNSVQLSGTASDVDTNDFITSWEWAVYVDTDTTVLSLNNTPQLTSSDTTLTYNYLTSLNLSRGRTYDLTLTVKDRALAVGTARSTLTIGSNSAPIAIITGHLPT